MREITFGMMITSLKIKPGDEVMVFTEARVFKGILVRIYKANLGVSMEVNMKMDNGEELTVDVELTTDNIIGMAKAKNEKFQIVPDSKISEDQLSLEE